MRFTAGKDKHGKTTSMRLTGSYYKINKKAQIFSLQQKKIKLKWPISKSL